MMVLVVVAVFCLSSWNTGVNRSTKTTWEYKVISTYGPSETNPPPNVAELNNAGLQGWELVAIRSGNFPEANSKQVRTDYYFNR